MIKQSETQEIVTNVISKEQPMVGVGSNSRVAAIDPGL
jgi:hypothetical protein